MKKATIIRIILLFSIMVIISGCFNLATPPSQITGSYVSPALYDDYDCKELAIELKSLARRENQLVTAQEGRRESSKIQAFWLGFGQGDGVEASELANVRGSKEAVLAAMDKKGCENIGNQIEVSENDQHISTNKQVPVATTNERLPNSKMAKEWADKSYESVLAKNWDEVIAASSVAISLDPNLIDPYINRAYAYCETGSPEKALEDCNKALLIEPTNKYAHNNKGYALELLGDKEYAAMEYKLSCDLGFDAACRNLEALSK
jgi:tetratricopeptide (TPR) repeat protein